jgi:hypothetical protein
VPAGCHRGPGFIIGKAQLARVSDGQEAVVGFISTDTDHNGGRAVLREPFGKCTDKGFKRHPLLVEIEIARIGNGIGRWLPDPVCTRFPALPFRLKLRQGVLCCQGKSHPPEIIYYIVKVGSHIFNMLDGRGKLCFPVNEQDVNFSPHPASAFAGKVKHNSRVLSSRK